MDDDETKPHAPATRMDLAEFEGEIRDEIRALEAELKEKLADHQELVVNTVRFYLRGLFGTIFVPALVAVIVGGYIVKYWL